MSLDATVSKLTAFGKVTITPDGILVEGFEGNGTSCRDVAVLACVWAIGELSRELMTDIETPGGSGRVAID